MVDDLACIHVRMSEHASEQEVLQVGKINSLTIVSIDPFGAHLDGGEAGTVLLPRAAFPAGFGARLAVGQTLEVFVFLDSDDCLTATTRVPLAQVGQFAVLRVVSIERIGAFLDWGLPKELLLPFAEQSRDLREGDIVVVFIYIDNSGRISSSMRLQRHLDKSKPTYPAGTEVDLLLVGKTDLGYKALVDARFFGVLYFSDVFQPLNYAQRVPGYVREVRPDGKIDLMLARAGRKAAVDDIAPLILERLAEAGGSLPINDKSTAEVIHAEFGVSRKKFKIALGGLYKQRKITVDNDGIHLV